MPYHPSQLPKVYFRSNARRKFTAILACIAEPVTPSRRDMMLLDIVTSLSKRMSESALSPLTPNSGSDFSSSTSAPRGERLVMTLVMNATINSKPCGFAETIIAGRTFLPVRSAKGNGTRTMSPWKSFGGRGIPTQPRHRDPCICLRGGRQETQKLLRCEPTPQSHPQISRRYPATPPSDGYSPADQPGRVARDSRL